MANKTTRAVKIPNQLLKNPLFSTYKEANLFGRRQLLKTRKRQLNSDQGISNLVSIGSKRSSRIERSKRGISDECCADTGCTFEEYAEYCPTNIRIRTNSNT